MNWLTLTKPAMQTEQETGYTMFCRRSHYKTQPSGGAWRRSQQSQPQYTRHQSRGIRSPAPQRSYTIPVHRSPLPQRSPKHKRKGQGSGRRSRRSRVDLALCIDLLGLTFTNLTLCWITPYFLQRQRLLTSNYLDPSITDIKTSTDK